jgi:uncharacterized protein
MNRMTSNAISVLFDANVWLALCHPVHPHHAAIMTAKPAFGLGGFCRVTQMTMLRLLTSRVVMGPDVLSPAQAWDIFQRLHDENQSRFFAEPDGLEETWRNLCKNYAEMSGNNWTDAYLAAFAICVGLQFVTFDRGFRRFRGLNCRVL